MFELISRRDGERSRHITTDRRFAEWHEVGYHARTKDAPSLRGFSDRPVGSTRRRDIPVA